MTPEERRRLYARAAFLAILENAQDYSAATLMRETPRPREERRAFQSRLDLYLALAAAPEA
jgi:hypothetical protein